MPVTFVRRASYRPAHLARGEALDHRPGASRAAPVGGTRRAPRAVRDYTAGGVQRRNGVSFSYAPGDGWVISSMTVPHGVFA
jgi:hypothetical protein